MRFLLQLTLHVLTLSFCLDASAQIYLQSGATQLTTYAGDQAASLTQLCLGKASCWKQSAPERFISSVEIDGHNVALQWRLNKASSQNTSGSIRMVYDARSTYGGAEEAPLLRAYWEWSVRGLGGPIEHTIRIENLSAKSATLPLQQSADFTWSVPQSKVLEGMWVEKGAGGPSAIGTHINRVIDGYKWRGTSSTYAHPGPGEQREMIPYLLLDDPVTGKGLYIGIEFSGRTEIRLTRKGRSVRVEAGLNPEPGPFRTRLEPGGSFEAPTVFLGTFRGGPDGAANTLRRWVRSVLNNPATIADPHYPLVVNNSWGSGMAINAAQARSMIRDSAELGFEMFHLDAGWFRGVGDWQPDPAKFPDGLAPIAEYAHQRGLKFGLWMDWALAGFDHERGAIYIGNPSTRDWLTTDPPPGWKPADPFKGVTMDIGDPPVHRWADHELSRVVRDYHLDMLEHDGYVVAQGCDRTDHPHTSPDPSAERRYEDSGFLWVDSSNSTDVSYHATRTYYAIYAKLRREHPELLLEICNDGGRMVDFGSAAHGDYFSISDAYDPLSNRRAFFDSSYVLPPAMLETYVEKWPAPTPGNFLYGLRSGMMGWLTLMLDTTTWTAQQHEAAKNAIALYKSRLRPLIRNADLYHVSSRPDGIHWDGMEYVDAAAEQGVLFAFRGSTPAEQAHAFVLRGLDPEGRYQLTFQDKSSTNRIVQGRELMQAGVRVTLPQPHSSELVFFEKVN